MQAVPGYSHLYRRGAIYWLRRRVPTDLREHLSFPEWKETLRTSRLEDAKERLRTRLVEIDREIATARAKAVGAPQPPLTRQEAATIARNHLAEWLSGDEEARLEKGEAAFEDVGAWLEAAGDVPALALAAGNWRTMARTAEMALEEIGRWYPADDPSRQLLAHELLKARVRFVELVTLRQRGEVVETPEETDLPTAVTRSSPASPEETVGLRDLIARFRLAREMEYGEESTRSSHCGRTGTRTMTPPGPSRSS